MAIQGTKIAEGINLYTILDNKFKNCLQGVFFSMPLKKETATTLALLPKLLTAANETFEDRTALHAKLETLYGARLKASAEKNGEMQVISFVGDTIADVFAGENLFSQMQTLLQDVLLNPKNNAFSQEVLDREKEALREDIRGVVNDKRRYALIRCAEEMCKDEPYGIRTDGEEENLDAITTESAWAVYREMLATARVDIFVTGAFDLKMAEAGARKLAAALGGRKASYPETIRRLPGAIKTVEEIRDVSQGKLVIGYRTDVDSASDEYSALMMYNGIFGGGTSSKLFNHVREEMSLCYYASSGLERLKGLLFVQSGIEISKYKVALDAILAQEEEIRKGNITEAEFSGTAQGIINQLRSYKASPGLLMGYYRRQVALPEITDIDTAIENIKKVTPEDVQRISRKVKMDTVYFLKGKEANA